MRRFIVVAIAILVAVLGFPARADVLIGVAGPMTGANAWYGEQMQRGAELAVADINAAGGVLGQQVRLITGDDFCDPKQAVAVAQNLVSEGVVFVIGHWCSGASIPASKVYEAAGVLQITPGSSNPLLTEQGRANVFRVYSRDDADGIVAGNYLADKWADKKIAILHDNQTFGKGLAELTKVQLNKRGVIEAIYEVYAPGKSDYSADIARLHAADIAVLYVGGYHTEVALMARAIRDGGYPIQLVTGSAIATEDFSLIAGPAAEGTLFTYLPDPRQLAEAAAIVERFRAENLEPEGYTLFTYGTVQVWMQAVKKAGSLELKAVIASLRNHEFDTVLGRIEFDDKGDLTSQSPMSSPIWYVWKGGEYVPLE